MSHVIPTMTHPLSVHWEQPPLSAVIVTGTQAIMERGAFDQLHEYSHTHPTGVYDGKMWKRKEKGTWYLVWWAKGTEPDTSLLDFRPLFVVESLAASVPESGETT